MSRATQMPLFDTPNAAPTSLVESLRRNKPEDKRQAAFQRLVKQLEEERSKLGAWQTYGLRYQQRLQQEVLPLQTSYHQTRRQLALQLDAAAGQPGLLRGKVQRSKLERLLIELTSDLLQQGPDAELEAIHDKYSSLSHAENQAEELAMSQDILEQLFGVDLGTASDARSIEDLYDAASEQVQQQATQRQRKRKTARQEAAEAKREQAAKEVSQTVRSVYRKLASALHPDRESDEAERARKTAQMQRVNQAYEAGDLLTLLNLQFEIEQIDADHLATLSDERLTHYNQILREQLAELKAEIKSATAPFAPLVPHADVTLLTPELIDRAVNSEILGLQDDLADLQRELQDLQQPENLKAMLKDYRPASRDAELEELDFLVAEMFAMSKPQRKRRGK